jgi:hypothetical protein
MRLRHAVDEHSRHQKAPYRRAGVPIVGGVRVEFFKPSEKHALCGWVATRRKRTVVPGPTMAAGKDLPHDLAQYVIEAATGYERGFWGLLAAGATFRSTGRRPTTPGRALIAANRQALVDSEMLAGAHMAAWRRGDVTPVTAALDDALAQWRGLTVGERLVLEWPAPSGKVVPPTERAGYG